MDLVTIDTVREDRSYIRDLCRHLEQGDILMVARSPFAPPEPDAVFLREQRQTARASHKNIAYKPGLDKVSGVDAESRYNAERTRQIISGYSRGVIAFLARLLPEYARYWKIDYASFRPVEEQGRNLPVRHRNDLMHLDAFPTRPTHGGRILRLFTNIHPSRDRVWGTADAFEIIAEQYAEAAGLRSIVAWPAATRRGLMRLGRTVGLKLPDRSPYDDFMLQFHHYLKCDEEFQNKGMRNISSFPPGASWITFTDQVAHKALSGQYALEQTFIVPYQAMDRPDLAPVAVLEKLAGCPLVTPRPLSENIADGSERVPA